MTRRRAGRLGVFGLSLAAIAFGLGGTVGGCGDSEGKKGGPQEQPNADASQTNPEGGPINGDSSVTPNTVTIDIVVPPVTVYPGQTAQLIASQSKASDGSPLNFGWTFTSVPTGSTITTSSLSGSNETVSFVPDIAGDYVLTVTATTGGTSAKKDVNVKAVNAPVFYVRTVSGATSIDEIGYEMRTVQMDGTGDHAVACRQSTFAHFPFHQLDASSGLDPNAVFGNEDGGLEGGAAMMFGFMNYFYMGMFADQAMDWWEAPAGESSHAAFQDIVFMAGDAGADADANAAPKRQKTSLFIATQDNSCQMPPSAARQFEGTDGDAVWQPKFSPDGRRIAFVEMHQDKAWVSTVSLDGSDYRQVAPVCPDQGKDCFKQYLFPRRPQWLDETHVGWMRTTSDFDSQTGALGWEIMVAPDLPIAPQSRYMSCTSGSAPLLFNFLRTGEVLTNLATSAKGAEDLIVLGRNGTGACHVVRNLTSLAGGDGSYARDFAISPDGTQVGYMQHTSDGKDAGLLEIRQYGDLYIVPLDGSKPPSPVGEFPRKANYGPRWIAGGNLLAWNGNAPPPPGYDAGFGIPDGGDASSLGDSAALATAFLEAGLPAMNVIQADGGGFLAVAYGDPQNGSYVMGGGNGGSCTLQCNGLGCTPQCDQKTLCSGTSSNCVVADKSGGTGAGFWASIFALGLFARRSRRSKRD